MQVTVWFLVEAGTISAPRFFWIVNGFSCAASGAGVQDMQSVPGVKEIFYSGSAQPAPSGGATGKGKAEVATGPSAKVDLDAFDPERFDPLW